MMSERTTKAMKWAAGGLLGLGLSFLTVQAADAATLRLGPDCGPTIQDCVNAAADGDLILVPRKTGKGKPNDGYYENVIVDKDVTIRGVANTRSQNCLDPRRAVDDLGRLRRNKTAVILGLSPDPGGDGFAIVAGGAGATIECFLIRHGQNAVDSDEDDVTVNKVVGIGQNSISFLMGADGQQVLDSLIIGSDFDGVEIDGADAVVRGTWVRNVGGDCIDIQGDNARVTDSHARRCEVRGFAVSGAEPKIGGPNPRSDGNTSISTDDHGFVIHCTGACGSGFVRSNTASEANSDDNGFDIVVGAGLGAGFEFSGNRAFKNQQRGFQLDVNEALIADNIAERNGTDGSNDVGLQVGGDGNTLLRNAARFNKRDGFQINGDGNTLGDGTDANRNRAIRNLVDGFDIQGDGNELDNNEAQSNEGEGIENNGAGTILTDNDSAGNRIDCAASVPPAVNSGNFCSDNSDFGVPPEVERQGDGRR